MFGGIWGGVLAGMLTLRKQTEAPTMPKRQAGTEIEVTPEMIEAGVSELRALIGDDRWINGDESVVTTVFSVMMEARPPCEFPGDDVS